MDFFFLFFSSDFWYFLMSYVFLMSRGVWKRLIWEGFNDLFTITTFVRRSVYCILSFFFCVAKPNCPRVIYIVKSFHFKKQIVQETAGIEIERKPWNQAWPINIWYCRLEVWRQLCNGTASIMEMTAGILILQRKI